MEDTPHILKIYDIIYSRVFPPGGWGDAGVPPTSQKLTQTPLPPTWKNSPPPHPPDFYPPHKRLIHPN